MADQAQATIHIKYVRSGIGFDYHTKQMIRSLGLTRLNQVVERQDTPQIRGQVAKIPHFVEIVDRKPVPAWHSTPEYTIHPPEAKPVKEAPKSVVEELQEVSHAAETGGETHEAPEAAPSKGKKYAAKEHAEKAAAREPETKAHKAAKQHAAPAAKGKAKTAKAEAPKHAAKAAHRGKSEKKGKK